MSNPSIELRNTDTFYIEVHIRVILRRHISGAYFFQLEIVSLSLEMNVASQVRSSIVTPVDIILPLAVGNPAP